MPPCKGHKKSRNGCMTCKKRRIKCDETRPQCLNCARHRVSSTCTYPNHSDVETRSTDSLSDASPLSTSSDSTVTFEVPVRISISSAPPATTFCATCSHTHSSSSLNFPWVTEFPGALPYCTMFSLLPPQTSAATASKVINPTQNMNSLSIIDLSLLHHFTICTSLTTFSPLPEIRHIWSHIVPGPEVAQKWSFALHAVLSTSAAHLAYVKNRKTDNTNKAIEVDQMLTIARRHYISALSLIKGELVDDEVGGGAKAKGITEENCHALFIASMGCAMYLISRRLISSSNDDSLLSECVLDTSWVIMIRSIFGILHQSWPWIHKGPVSLIIRPKTPYPGKAWQDAVAKEGLTPRTEAMLLDLNSVAGDWGLNLFGVRMPQRRDITTDAEDDDHELADIETATAYYIAIWNLRRVWVMIEECVLVKGADSDLEDVYFDDIHESQFQKEFPPKSRVRRRIRRPDAISSSIFQLVLRTPPRFWEELEKRKPRALIIYAYFCACWEVFTFGSQGSGRDSREEELFAWWTTGRAEMDLKGIETEFLKLDHGRTQEHSDSNINRRRKKTTWRDWLQGAREVIKGLKEGWWFDIEDGDLKHDDVDRHMGRNAGDTAQSVVLHTHYPTTFYQATSLEFGEMLRSQYTQSQAFYSVPYHDNTDVRNVFLNNVSTQSFLDSPTNFSLLGPVYQTSISQENGTEGYDVLDFPLKFPSMDNHYHSEKDRDRDASLVSFSNIGDSTIPW